MNKNNIDLSIIGLGAASYAAALYAVRYQIPTVMIGEDFGGETATGGLIENYPGVPEIDGYDLMLNMKQQVENYNIKPLVVKFNHGFMRHTILKNTERTLKKI